MSCFHCYTRKGQQQKQQRVHGNLEVGKINEPIVVDIKTSDGNGTKEQETGILIHNNLVLTSHMGFPSKESTRESHIVLRSVASNSSHKYSTQDKWCSSSTKILTRKLQPQRYFVTNPSLGVTIVACEPVKTTGSTSSSSTAEVCEIPTVSEDGLKLGSSVYVLGPVQQNYSDRKEGLLMFGEGLISREDEQVIEFYSLDGFVWAPGSAGFDARGTFAFVVGDRPIPPKLSCPLPKRWSYAFSKGPGSRQAGILIHAVRDWTKDTWSGDFKSLLQLQSNTNFTNEYSTSAAAELDLKQKAEEEQLIEHQRVLSQRIDQIQKKMREDRDSVFAMAGPLTRSTSPKIARILTSLHNDQKISYAATNLSPKITEIPVQACFLSSHQCASSNTLRGIAALAANELERFEQEAETRNSPLHEAEQVLEDLDGTPKLESPSCWLSSWWSNFRAKSPQRQGPKNEPAAADGHPHSTSVDHLVGREEEYSEPNSPPRRFLARGAYTVTPRREWEYRVSPQRDCNASVRLDYRLRKRTPSPPRTTVRPCESTPPGSPTTRLLSPGLAYRQIHRSPIIGGCPRQSDIPWRPPGGGGITTARRSPSPEPPPRLNCSVARTRTHSRDYCPPRSEDEQKKLDDNASAERRKVPAGLVEEQGDEVLRSPREENEVSRWDKVSEGHSERRNHPIVSRTTPTLLLPEITCFQKWKNLVSRKKNIALESMKSLQALCSPRTISNSITSSSRGEISPQSTAGSPRIYELEEPFWEKAQSSSFPQSPLSINNSTGCPAEQYSQDSIYEHARGIPDGQEVPSYDARISNWAMEQEGHETTNESVTRKDDETHLKIWDPKPCIAETNQQNEVIGSSIISKRCHPVPGPSTSTIFKVVASETAAFTKEQADQQRKEQRRPRWSIARVDKGPTIVKSVFDPMEDLRLPTKTKVLSKSRPPVVRERALVCHEEVAVSKCAYLKRNTALSALANHKDVSMFKREADSQGEGDSTSTRSTSPGRKSQCKPKVPPYDNSTQLRSASKRLLEAAVAAAPAPPPAKISSSSEKEGRRPRWRCP